MSKLKITQKFTQNRQTVFIYVLILFYFIFQNYRCWKRAGDGDIGRKVVLRDGKTIFTFTPALQAHIECEEMIHQLHRPLAYCNNASTI